MSTLSSNLDDFGNFATSSSISHLVFSHSRPQPCRRHLDVYNRGETQDDWLLVGYNMGAVGADRALKLFLFLLLLSLCHKFGGLGVLLLDSIDIHTCLLGLGIA